MSEPFQYVDAVQLEKELIAFRKTSKISEKLGDMFKKIAENLINRKNFINYTFRDDMMGRGILFMCKYSKNYDVTNPRCNAFAYVSQICSNGFIQCIKEERKHSDIKDGLIKQSMEKSELDKFMDTEKSHLDN
jgi:hypothetical protein